MNKLELNNKIVLSRPVVRKARVTIIRKKIKQLKLLKTCQKDFKDKKKRKADRLLEEIHIMKKIRDDDVTRFALQFESPDLKKFVSNTPVNEYEHIYSIIALHPEVQKAVAPVRDTDPKLIKSLLETLGERTVLKKVGGSVREINHFPKEDKPKKKTKVKVTDDEIAEEITVPKQEIVKKVVDSFFIDKEVIAPKLQISEIIEKPELEKVDQFKKKNINSKEKIKSDRLLPYEKLVSKTGDKSVKSSKEKFKNKSFVSNKTVNSTKLQHDKTKEKLHPSWAAKKAPLIKPFEGKKIKFE